MAESTAIHAPGADQLSEVFGKAHRDDRRHSRKAEPMTGSVQPDRDEPRRTARRRAGVEAMKAYLAKQPSAVHYYPGCLMDAILDAVEVVESREPFPSDEDVERIARLLHDQRYHGWAWEHVRNERTREQLRQDARVVLDAVSPHRPCSIAADSIEQTEVASHRDDEVRDG